MPGRAGISNAVRRPAEPSTADTGKFDRASVLLVGRCP